LHYPRRPPASGAVLLRIPHLGEGPIGCASAPNRLPEFLDGNTDEVFVREDAHIGMVLPEPRNHQTGAGPQPSRMPVVDAAKSARRATLFEDYSDRSKPVHNGGCSREAVEIGLGYVLPGFSEDARPTFQHVASVPADDCRRGARRGQAAEHFGTNRNHVHRARITQQQDVGAHPGFSIVAAGSAEETRARHDAGA